LRSTGSTVDAATVDVIGTVPSRWRIPDRVIYYQYRTTGPGEPCAASMSRLPRPNRAVDGKAPVKRNQFIKLTRATTSVNRDLEANARALAGRKGYTTNLTSATPEFVIDAYHQL
jgi:hypothetical protein